VNGFFVVALVALGVLFVALVLDDVLDGLTDALGGPDWLSLPVLAAVVAGFGLVAGAVEGAAGATLPALLAGGAGGLGTGWLTARFVSAAMAMPTDPPIRHADLAGRAGFVVTAVAPLQPGEVLVALGGVRHKLRACAEETIAVGREIVVVEVSSPTTVVVAPLGLDELPPPPPGRDP
jgi:membrane-bound ClpP family serine protease